MNSLLCLVTLMIYSLVLIEMGEGCMGVVSHKNKNNGMDTNLSRYHDVVKHRYVNTKVKCLLDTFVEWNYCPTNKHYNHDRDKDKQKQLFARRGPRIFEKFDWVIWDTFEDKSFLDNNRPPDTVLIRNDFFHRRFYGRYGHLQIFANLSILSGSEKRILVVAGDDDHLTSFATKRSHINYLRARFSDMFHSAKNMRSDDFKTVPLGLFNPYLLAVGYEQVEKAYGVATSLPPAQRERLILGAWGSKHAGLDKRIEARKTLQHYLADRDVVFQREHLTPAAYWKALPQYKYSFCPTGNGIQSPKLYESWLLRVVPVTLREPAFDDLQSYGFPLVIVDSWYEVNTTLLEALYADTYRHTNWTRVEYLMSTEGVFQFIQDGVYRI